MEHLLLRSKCSIFLNISKNLTFQRCPKALVWSKGLKNVAPWTLGSLPEYDY